MSKKLKSGASLMRACSKLRREQWNSRKEKQLPSATTCATPIHLLRNKRNFNAKGWTNSPMDELGTQRPNPSPKESRKDALNKPSPAVRFAPAIKNRRPTWVPLEADATQQQACPEDCALCPFASGAYGTSRFKSFLSLVIEQVLARKVPPWEKSWIKLFKSNDA
jgi:hypothetical protein